jgi:hypothetical protein
LLEGVAGAQDQRQTGRGRCHDRRDRQIDAAAKRVELGYCTSRTA